MSKTTDQYLEQQEKETQLTEVSQTPQLKDEATILISQAIDKNVDVATMEKLLDMRRQLKEEHAKEVFNQSMKKFQAVCPIIGKNSVAGNNNYGYKYATIDHIAAIIKPLLAENGFSYTFNTKKTEQSLITYCIVIHEAGWEKVSEFEMAIDKNARMNDSQKDGSANSYGKRYALCNAFGIIIGGEDNDAATTQDTYKTREKMPEIETPAPTGVYPITDKQLKDINDLIKEKKISEENHDKVLAKFHVSETSKLSAGAAQQIYDKYKALPTPKDFKFKKPEGLELTEPI